MSNLTLETLPFGPRVGAVMQVAYLVADIERAIATWSATLGIGPFFHFPHFSISEVLYRGQPSAIDLDVALAFSGSMCFELLQQNDAEPSVFQDQLRTRGYGFHHWGVATRSFDADLARHAEAGAPNVSSCVVGVGARTAYVDTVPQLGAMIELIEMTPAVEELFAMIRSAADGWDGRDPVRVLTMS